MRLALILPSDMTAEQRPLCDDMKAGISAKYSAFTTIRDDGTILGLPLECMVTRTRVGHCNLGRHEGDDALPIFAGGFKTDRDSCCWNPL
jgi:hypothetical protein